MSGFDTGSWRLIASRRATNLATHLPSPLPSGTLATFFLTAFGPIQHTKEGDITCSREKTILMTSLRLERAAAVS